ncbi:hypothetical protein POM88_006564 [Heracleum sosnowskyi]|uniref:Transposase-associated domain-containing protein n=1 Tax=Heracleum sosnowskyi TaxID=360622 RepID=A0AAD8J5P7_9APIA|nr:hypothetical protein POM88_006564 [Heracleum sosnowskyi]
MDRQIWMYNISRIEEDYIKGVQDFILCALRHQSKKEKENGYKDLISFPCHLCGNLNFFDDIDIIKDHLFRYGFKRNYTTWIWHGEVMDSSGTSDSHRNYGGGDSVFNNDEDDMGNDRGYVKSRYRPEGSIVEAYSVEEAIEFCTEYLEGVDSIGIPRSRHEGRLEGYGTLGMKMISPGADLLDTTHLFVLQHMTEVNVYLEEHVARIWEMHPSKRNMYGLPTKERRLPADKTKVDHPYRSVSFTDLSMDENANSGSKKRTRGPTTCKKLKETTSNKAVDKTVELDAFGKPLGKWQDNFTFYVGAVFRQRVDINIESWKDVNQRLKDTIWQDIKSKFSILVKVWLCDLVNISEVIKAAFLILKFSILVKVWLCLFNS